MLMASEFVRVVGTRGARTTGQVSRSLRGMLRSPRATRRCQPVHPGPPERQRTEIDAADGSPAALERCGLLSAAAAFHLAFAVVGSQSLDPVASCCESHSHEVRSPVFNTFLSSRAAPATPEERLGASIEHLPEAYSLCPLCRGSASPLITGLHLASLRAAARGFATAGLPPDGILVPLLLDASQRHAGNRATLPLNDS
jgi:hypothetical protein